MSIFNTIKTHPYLMWCSFMFPYGFYRQYKLDYKAPYDLFTYKLIFSTINGLTYVSPLGIVKLVNLLERCQISFENKNKETYKSSYQELIFYNFNTL